MESQPVALKGLQIPRGYFIINWRHFMIILTLLMIMVFRYILFPIFKITLNATKNIMLFAFKLVLMGMVLLFVLSQSVACA